MTKESKRIIGINPGTRYLGIAILYGSELMDWRIKVLNGKWSKDKIKKAIEILSDIFDKFEPNILALKKLHPSRRSENLNQLVKEIKEFSRRKGLKLCQNQIRDLEGNFISEGKPNKKNLADALAARYSEFCHEINRDRKKKNPYFFRTFEAVALAATCSKKMEKLLTQKDD